MKNNQESRKIKIFIVAVPFVILAAFGYYYFVNNNKGPAKYDAFATCLKETGTKFYGAFWCPHCQQQKKMFGSSAKKLPYIECSTANGQGMLDVCKNAGVDSYPTWEFPDGSRVSGEQSLETLSQKSSCQLPQ